VHILHESKVGDLKETYRLKAEDELKKVNVAFEILRDPEKRR